MEIEQLTLASEIGNKSFADAYVWYRDHFKTIGSYPILRFLRRQYKSIPQAHIDRALEEVSDEHRGSVRGWRSELLDNE